MLLLTLQVIIEYNPSMQVNNVNQQRDQSSQNNKKILFIICIYLFLTLSSRYTQDTRNVGETIKNKLRTGVSEITVNDVAQAFELEEVYEGKWGKIDRNDVASSNKYVNTNGGKFEMKMSRLPTFTTDYKYSLSLVIFNGEYIDEGTITYDFIIDSQNFNSQRNKFTELVLFLDENGTKQGKYYQQYILISVQSGVMNISTLNFSFSLKADQSLDIHMTVDVLDTNLSLQLIGQDHKMVKIMIFAAIMFVASYAPFSSIMSILKSLYDARDNASNYSLITICVTSMWDAVLCLVAFIYAFKDQESLMLFIMPAFLLCLLFTNLQPRFMIMIYKNIFDNPNIRQMMCKFNLLHYGTLLITYPLLLFLNFNWVLFISMSCIVFPQIYVNGLRGTRPDLSSAYYSKYLLGRFVILFYLKCFPLNVFCFKPDYFLGVICLALISFQFILLYIQKIYGSKKIIPTFLLDPVFNYQLEEQFNIQEGLQTTECSICLTALHTDAPQNPNELQFEPAFKMMETPCKHKYHSRCLMVWMKIKMQCPQCRYKLPPYE